MPRDGTHNILRHARRRGYTLVEVLTVVTIVALLATLATIGARWAIADAERVTFAENLRQYGNACEMYRLKYGSWPRSAPAGQLPEGLEEFIDEDAWTNGTPVGGDWVYSFGGAGDGAIAALGVAFSPEEEGESDDVLQMRWAALGQSIDRYVDDGNLDTGSFRQADAGTFYYTLE